MNLWRPKKAIFITVCPISSLGFPSWWKSAPVSHWSFNHLQHPPVAELFLDKMNLLPHLLLASLAILPVVLSLKAGDCEVCISVIDRLVQKVANWREILSNHILFNFSIVLLGSVQHFPKKMKQIKLRLKQHSRSSANLSSWKKTGIPYY